MIDDGKIILRVRDLFKKEPELKSLEKIYQAVWRYFEVYGNGGKELLYIMKDQFIQWQLEHGTIESILRAMRLVRKAGENPLSKKHLEFYGKKKNN